MATMATINDGRDWRAVNATLLLLVVTHSVAKSTRHTVNVDADFQDDTARTEYVLRRIASSCTLVRDR